MPRLSLPAERLQSHYTVVVVGSGYGGAIAASRMSRAGRQVCVLERGKEFQPGEYPDTEPEALAEMQVDLPDAHVGSKTALYDFRVNPDIDVFLGCGLGGTSLVNANVALRAEPRVFDDPRWPAEVRADRDGLLQDSYQHAEEMLKPTPLPASFPKPPKLDALELSAKHLQANCYRTPINVTFSDGVNHVGVQQTACTGCGDCVTGCNVGAKNTVLMNYLPDAVNHGAEIFTGIGVRRLERDGNQWRVYYQILDAGRDRFETPELFLTADIVMLGAGTLGSTEILLRSKANGLPLSDVLGKRFTGNGDVLGFGYNTDHEINGVGFGSRSASGRKPVGPCITGVIDKRSQPQLDDGMVIEEGSLPGALSGFLPGSFALAAATGGRRQPPNPQELLREGQRQVESLVGGAYTGAVRNTQTYLVMTHDGSDGRMLLEDDRLRIDWPGIGASNVFDRVNDTLAEASAPLGGFYVRNPTWSPLLRHNLVTVHPLGGCPMGADAAAGVVNHKGQVFSSSGGADAYDSLYVCDGAVMPRSLGVNPLLTISALAERCCALAAKDRGWNIDYRLPSARQVPAEARAAGIEFTERMSGQWKTATGPSSAFEFTLTIASENVERTISDPQHKASMAGTAIAPGLSAKPLAVSDGEFQLFVENQNQVETRNMVYRMVMQSEEGKRYHFEGKKIIRQNSILSIWHDTSTLYITIRDGGSADAPVLGTGELHILPSDFARQLTTMKAINTDDPVKRLEATARFGRFFAGTLYDTYGGVFARATAFDPDRPPRKKRSLRVDAPQVYPFQTSDGVELKLTRYRGGSKGPVILSHGLGVSSLIFAIDTIETNLLEYLFAHGYDVWLLDYRASIELPAAAQPANGDDIATRDYPAAVAKVREVTGASSVQMVAHCYGSTTLTMALLAGLQGVRSVVFSQVSTHAVAPTATRLKTGLHVPDFLGAIGVNSLTAYVDTHADWRDRIFDAALKLYPMAAAERCQSPVCHRITFLYAPLYEHAQLNEATHEALHEMFGVANIHQFEHLGQIVRKGHVVSAGGEDIYLPHLERMAFPIRFIHGAENECFLPRSTEITFDLLRQKNGKDLYSRTVIPNYGHIDCIFGKDACRDVYPSIVEHLEATAARPAAAVAAG